MSEAGDPKRLAAGAPSSELGQLMASATRDVPSDAELEGLAERLGAVLGPVQPTPVPRGSSILVKLGITTGVVALIAGGVLALRTHFAPHPSQSTPASALPPAPVVSPAALDTRAIASPAPSPAPVAIATVASSSLPGSAAPPTKIRSSVPAADGPSEAKLLEQARRVLQSDPASALALTNQDATLFPHGALVQEREVIAIEALRRLNRATEADRRAAAFSKSFPGSAHQRVVEDAASK